MPFDTSVKYFSSDMPGAPVLSGTVGSFITLLDACLINGFGTVTLDSLVVASNVATASVSTGHGLAMIGNTGPVIQVAGVTPAALNGEWRVAEVVNSTTFTFAVESIADQTASGTITAKRAGAGWAKPFSGTNKAVYARTALESTAMVLRVDDTAAQSSRVTMYEAMTGIDVGTGSSEVVAVNHYLWKSQTANETPSLWTFAVDDRLMLLFSNCTYTESDWRGGLWFGDILNDRTPDAYACILVANLAASLIGFNTNAVAFTTSAGAGSVLARSYTQTGGAIAHSRVSHSISGGNMGTNGMATPSPVDGCFHVAQIDVLEGGLIKRGTMPGMFNPLHNSTAGANRKDVFETTSGVPNRTLVVGILGSGNRYAIDVTGPWR